MAANALPTYTGLAPQCSNFAQTAAVAAAATQGTAPDAACPASRQLACSQAQLRPDTQTQQSGAYAQWPVNATGGSAGSPVVWRPPSGSVAGRPAKVELSLEGGTPPAFTYGPAFPADMRAGRSFGMQFALDKPALLIYAGEKWEEGESEWPEEPSEWESRLPCCVPAHAHNLQTQGGAQDSTANGLASSVT